MRRLSLRGLADAARRWHAAGAPEPGGERAGSAEGEALLARLPPFAREAFRRREPFDPPLATPADLFGAVSSWLSGTGIAQGRGGYPGGRGKPDWTDYVAEQRRSVAVFRALVDVFGEPAEHDAELLSTYEQSFPPPVRHMGDGHEPHVDDVAGRLIYSLPVDSSFVGTSFAFEIGVSDLRLLLADPYRRAVLEVVAHTVLQHSMIRGNPEVTPAEFRRLVNGVLHSTPEALATLIATVGRDYNIRVEHYARAAMVRREGNPPCGS